MRFCYLANVSQWLRLCVVFLAMSAGGAHAAPFAYIGNFGSNNITVIDVATHTPITTIAMPPGAFGAGQPYGVVVNATGTRVYVAGYYPGNSMTVIDSDPTSPTFNTVIANAVLGANSNPYGIAINPAGTHVYVVTQGLGGDLAFVYSTANNALVTTIPIAHNSYGMAFKPDGTRAYVAAIASNSIAVIDTDITSGNYNTQIAVPNVGGVTFDVAVNPAGTLAYLSRNDGNVVVLDTTTNAVVTAIPVGVSPRGIVLNPAGTRVYVANFDSDTVSVIRTSDNTVIDTITVGDGPAGLSFNFTGSLLYVTNYYGGNVSVIDVANGTVIATVPVGVTPVALGHFIATTVPGAPGIGASTPGNAQATIAFTTPASDGGAPIISYTTTCNPGAFTISGPGSPLTVSGLTNGTTYSCSVTAANGIGSSIASGNVAVTPATVPDAPAIVSVTPGDTRISVAFSPPGSDGGNTITSYTATCGALTASGPASPLMVTGLTNDVSYTCIVTATNGIGTGLSSPPSVGAVPFASAPSIAKVFAASPIVVGQSSLLTITISNPNPVTMLTGVAFSDTLPAGVSATNASVPGCNGGTVAVNANVISLASGSITSNNNCSVSVTVTGAQAQVAAWVNTINSVTSTQGGTNSTPANASITVSKAATTTTLVSDGPDPTIVGEPYMVTFSVLVTAPGAGLPGGTVTVSDGTDSCTGAPSATSCQLTSSTSGAKLLTATYGGNTNFSGSTSATAPHQVNKVATTSAITSHNPHPSVVGTGVAVSANVAYVPPGPGTPSGNVSISDGVNSCSFALPATSCTWTPATVGTRMLVATYAGDAGFADSVSSSVSHVVVAFDQQSTLTVTRLGSGGGLVSGSDSVIDCGVTCAHTYANGTTLTLAVTASPGSVFTGWLGACTGIGACTLGISSAVNVSATFASGTALPTTDIDGNSSVNALTDGALMMRRMLGLSGSALTSGAIGGGTPSRSDPADVLPYLVDLMPLLDVDGNGQADAATDGVMVLRYLFGLRGAPLTAGVMGAGATRTSPEIEAHILSLMP